MEKYRTTLPAGYREADVIDIKKDKRVRVWGDILSVLLMAATVGVGCLVVPLAELTIRIWQHCCPCSCG